MGRRSRAIASTTATAAAAAILGCAIVTAGCAAGRQYAYEASPRMKQRGSLSVALAVQDQRESVRLRGKRPSFVGFQRAGLGNPFDVTTASGQPLANDFATSIRYGLQRAGYRVIPVSVNDRAPLGQAREALIKTGAERGMLVQIGEWKSDTHTNTSLEFGVSLLVLDPSGEELARTSISGKDNLGGSVMDPAGHAERVVPQAFARKLEQLLNDPEIARALTLPPSDAAPGAPPDTHLNE